MLCIALIEVYPHVKFQVSSFSRSGDIEGVPKFKSRSRNLGHAPFVPYFCML